jgi:hypothetical protein
MEIHPPHQPVHSLREMLTHLALVTMGVLIALSFEGIGTWREHRALVREARANIRNEIRDNQKELEGVLQAYPKLRLQLEHATDVAQMLLDHKKLEHESIRIEFEGADLQSASRTTAEVTGAFALMAYEEVKTYASVYGHQDAFIRGQNEGIQNVTHALSFASAMARAETPSAREIEDWKQQIRLAIGSLTVEGQLGAALLKDYDHVLKERGP